MQSHESEPILESGVTLPKPLLETRPGWDLSSSNTSPFASLRELTATMQSPDAAAVMKLYGQADLLVEHGGWEQSAKDLYNLQSSGSKWLAAAMFEAGNDFPSATEALESFSCVPSRSAEAMRLLAIARTLSRSGKAPEAVAPLKRAIRLSESYRSLNACGKVLKSLERAGAISYARTCRLAVLGNATFDFHVPVLKTVAFASGIELIVHNGAYGQQMQEVLDGKSGLARFGPRVIVLATNWHALGLPEESSDPEAAIAQRLAEATGTWAAISARFDCHIIQHNFVVPEVSSYGGLSSQLLGGRGRILRQLNLEISQVAATRPEVSVLDVDQIASLIGKRVWHDSRMWIAAKQYPSAEALGLLAAHQVSLLRAILGLSSKCIVLDLDNTLWGGVIGEDGLEGIRLGGGPEGEAFVAFQIYLKGLRDRGVMLAICSKNNEADARLPFEKHPEMVLRLDDISLFVANWLPKPENLKAIAARLNIGTDSLVFVDDNPFERELVRKRAPEIEVFELPSDPAQYVEALDRELYFETLSLTLEDKARADSYRANQDRNMLRESSGSIDDFLSGLQMRIELRPFDQPNLPRIVQLINKTNQFNLTTPRMTAEQVISFAAAPGNYTGFMHLRDRYGDSGITGILMASPKGEALSIDVWLLSCRVLGRQAEDAMLSAVWRFARASGFRFLLGTFDPTAKNQQVADLYARMGFPLVETKESGKRYYRVELLTDRPFPMIMDVSDLTCLEFAGCS